MVNMSQEGNNRRPRRQIGGIVHHVRDRGQHCVFEADGMLQFDFGAKLHRQKLNRLNVQFRVDRAALVNRHQLPQNYCLGYTDR